jgi:hypothetical protein
VSKEVVMRTIVLGVLAAGLVAAVTATSAGADGGPALGAQLGWDGVRAPGAEVRYVALTARSSTNIAAIRVRDGRVLRWNTLRGGFGIPSVAWDGTTGGLSADGRSLVLASLGAGPVYGGTTRFVVLRTSSLRPRRMIRLHGLWSFDAVSPDGATVYAIEYLADAPSVRYRVRAIDVATGRARPGAIVDRREPDEQMVGSPVTRAAPRDGSWAYTLYIKPNGTAFVHALDAVHARAVCIDLPWRRVARSVWSARMSVTPDGRTLRLFQRGVGVLATVDARSFAVNSLRRPVVP